MSQLISAVDPHPRTRVRILDTEMSYVDVGQGAPVVFLHGNPTSSYLWRNIIPHLSPFARCLAPDLVGMGESGASPTGNYRFFDHARYLDAWFDAVGLTNGITLVLHDWGGALGFFRAFRHPEQIRALAYMETFVQPRRWDDLRPASQEAFRRFRSEEGESLILIRTPLSSSRFRGAFFGLLQMKKWRCIGSRFRIANRDAPRSCGHVSSRSTAFPQTSRTSSSDMDVG